MITIIEIIFICFCYCSLYIFEEIKNFINEKKKYNIKYKSKNIIDVIELENRLKLTLENDVPKTNKNYCIIGIGSLGLSILDLLIQRGERNIITFDICDLPKKYLIFNVRHFKGDIANYKSIHKLLFQVDVVFLNASLINWWENFSFEYQKA